MSVNTFEKIYFFLYESIHFGEVDCYFGVSEAGPGCHSADNLEDLIVFLKGKKLNLFLLEQVEVNQKLADDLTAAIAA